MNLKTAREIAQFVAANKMVQAIRTLRVESAMGLIDAKHYLEQHYMGGEESLFKRLCDDFLENKVDILVLAKAEHRRLTLYIQQLETEIEEEKRSETGKEQILEQP